MGSTYYDDIMSTLINELEQPAKFKKILSNEGRKSLTIIRYIKSEATYHSCPILCDEFEENQEITRLPCNHCFNSGAIEKWLTEEKSECPICRLQLDYNKVDNPSEAQAHDIRAHDIPIFADMDAAYTLINSLNRVSNFTSNVYDYGRARVMSEDDDIEQAIIASLNDLSSSG